MLSPPLPCWVNRGSSLMISSSISIPISTGVLVSIRSLTYFNRLFVSEAIPNTITTQNNEFVIWMQNHVNNIGFRCNHLCCWGSSRNLFIFQMITNGSRKVQVFIHTPELGDKSTSLVNSIHFSILLWFVAET